MGVVMAGISECRPIHLCDANGAICTALLVQKYLLYWYKSTDTDAVMAGISLYRPVYLCDSNAHTRRRRRGGGQEWMDRGTGERDTSTRVKLRVVEMYLCASACVSCSGVP